MAEILVAVDDSEHTVAVADFVNSFFGPLDVAITAIHVSAARLDWTPPGAARGWAYLPPLPPVPVVDVAAAQTRVEDGEAVVARSGVAADGQVVELADDVAETLRRVAEERDVALIVVGASHKALLQRLVDPAVAPSLAKRAPRPVLIVH